MDNVTKCHCFYVAKELIYYGTQVHLDLCIYTYNDEMWLVGMKHETNIMRLALRKRKESFEW